VAGPAPGGKAALVVDAGAMTATMGATNINDVLDGHVRWRSSASTG
jgi:hypothetical protein